MWNGPQPQSRADRLQIVDRIVADLHRSYGDQIKAMALYGSLARGSDGDYSDIELWCVLKTPDLEKGLKKREEWVYGPSKAEVDLYGEEEMRADVLEVGEMWALEKGAFIN